MLAAPTPLQDELLRPFTYQANDVDLHSDVAFMPKKRLAWGSWNYRSDPGGNPSIHYWMNNLQGVSKKENYFVSLNSRDEISPDMIRKNLQYDHPLFDLDAMAAQARLPELNVDGRIHFSGSYFRYGFHEDAFKSAVDLSQQLLEGDPWARV